MLFLHHDLPSSIITLGFVIFYPAKKYTYFVDAIQPVRIIGGADWMRGVYRESTAKTPDGFRSGLVSLGWLWRRYHRLYRRAHLPLRFRDWMQNFIYIHNTQAADSRTRLSTNKMWAWGVIRVAIFGVGEKCKYIYMFTLDGVRGRVFCWLLFLDRKRV